MYLDELAEVEKQNLQTMERLENEVLSFTVSALASSIKAFLASPNQEHNITSQYAAIWKQDKN